ncbi:MAG: ANTAR domain-containing protein, partial [Streptomyces sp.]|uniref:ANTAR domain-containing protein n=1 Tax=Streptomyces sp. TaxID=1931 RepID=UPI003D6B0981
LRAAKEAQIQAALESHAVVDQAVGMVRLAQSCDHETAWGIVKRLSQNTNTKLRTIAEAVIQLATDEEAAPLPKDLHKVVQHALTPPKQR